MANLREKLKHINSRLDQLIIEKNEYNSKINVSNEKLELAENQLIEKNAEIEELKNQLKITKLAKKLESASADQKKEIRLKINEYIREIDRCIAEIED